MSNLRTLDDLDVTNKTVLVRVDLNVPMMHGKVEDATRIMRLVPTLKALVERDAKIVVLSHFGRPTEGFDRDMSLAPLADELGKALGREDIKFAVDCVGKTTKEAVKQLNSGDIILLENVRFYEGEMANDAGFAKQLADLGDCYVNDTFSCAHRSHASIVGIAELLPSAAGLLLQNEIENLERVLTHPKPPLAAIVGGAKVSTKLELLENLIEKVDLLVVGGAMANTFLKAKGYDIGISLYEEKLVTTAAGILKKAEKTHCEILLPEDVVVTKEFAPHAPCEVVSVDSIPSDAMALDVGPMTIASLDARLQSIKSVVWNGPMGAFEMSPFDVGTISLARIVAALSRNGSIISVAGGGDVVAALKRGGLVENFTYISTAGGAFLEWLEGKELPGVRVLQSSPEVASVALG